MEIDKKKIPFFIIVIIAIILLLAIIYKFSQLDYHLYS